MADSKPYKYCHHCGNRFSNESLTDHERQCKNNERQKVQDSFDFKTKKHDAKTMSPEDNDRVKEMKEMPKTTLEEELIKETESKMNQKKSGKIPSPQTQLLNETEQLREKEKDKLASKKDSTEYSSDDLSQGGTEVKRVTPTKVSSSRPKKIDPITGRKKPYLSQDKDNQDNKAFPNPRKVSEDSKPSKVAKKTQVDANEDTEKKSTSSPKKEGSRGKESDQSKDNKATQNSSKVSDSLKSEPSPKYSSISCNCSKELTSNSKVAKNDEISQTPKPRKKSESKASKTHNPAKKISKKVSSSSPKKIDPITGRKKSHQSQDKDNKDNKAFPNPRKVSEDSKLQPSPRYSSRSCECARKYSRKDLNNAELVDEKNKLKVKSTQGDKSFPIMNKFDKSPDKKKVNSKEIAQKREGLEKDNEKSKKDALAKIDKQFLCKYCGRTLVAEDVPTHERLCERRPYKEHELKVERKL
ncbi:hypothetical protein JTE90_014154 [Oedothorax gibbosus]|uniref:Uncharacterized protein n=1 Tax=Oedothorax gibbosus TaxID=931172 RepID=A0AAV6VLI8_9ARAC|nr:hypothetical protein JTE90_014154 [Oedothorax gibbosus]